MSWLCSCGLINSGLNQHCSAMQQKQYQHEQISPNKPDFIMYQIVVNWLKLKDWRLW